MGYCNLYQPQKSVRVFFEPLLSIGAGWSR
jgi:hypothetical protein